jgi:phosphoenolpyruvate synthase/pyruvate phosphate dikinase
MTKVMIPINQVILQVALRKKLKKKKKNQKHNQLPLQKNLKLIQMIQILEN